MTSNIRSKSAKKKKKDFYICQIYLSSTLASQPNNKYMLVNMSKLIFNLLKLQLFLEILHEDYPVKYDKTHENMCANLAEFISVMG